MTQKRTLDLNKIINKTIELIRDKGLAETTMPALAEALGVRSQSLYHYISGRKQLLSLVGANRIKVLEQKLVKNLIGFSGYSALLKFADIIRDFVLNDPALSSILYHLNEYSKDAAINREILNIITLAEKLNLEKDNAISLHALIGAVLGYVFLDKSSFFSNESKDEANSNYHEMILRLVQPTTILQN